MPHTIRMSGLTAVATLSMMLLTLFPAGSSQATDAPQAQAAQPRAIDARPWPRKYSIDGKSFTLYQPELDSWTGNRLQGRAAMAVTVGQARDADGKTRDEVRYGVVWFTSRTETDKDAREVTLHDTVIERASFPSAKEREAEFASLARKVAPRTGQVVSLDLLESQLAITKAVGSMKPLAVNNDPPEVVMAYEPTVLVLVDGAPQFKPTRFEGIERLVNTRSLIARFQGKFYLFYAGHTAISIALDAGWTAAKEIPETLTNAYNEAVAQKLIAADTEVPEGIRQSFEGGKFPKIVLRTKQAELLEFDGEPAFEPIEGTGLAFSVNTPADVFLDTAADNTWYVLLSGRWFKAATPKGPWTFVAPDKLPAGFAQIPGDHPKSAVLASVPGTPEATESLIANSVPQTASVKRSEAKFETTYDGEPRFEPIEGTSLHYAVNTSLPVIQVNPTSYFAVRDGVWFTAPSPSGPWQVATSVPSVIYTIPTSSPLHYVTYVEVYGTSGDTVYVGYTPGYYGTVASNGVVVYGTGYACSPWVGSYWYGCPWTYGYGVAFGWSTAAGWGFTFGYGWYNPWYGPWWGPWYGYYPGYPYYGWGGAVIGNVYGRWGNTVIGGTGAAWANPWTGNYGRGFRGGYYNERTGAAGIGRGGSNYNVYTGNLTRAGQGVRYNPNTGRITAGTGGTVRNLYTGEAAAAGRGTVINTDTGRVTTGGGVAAVGDNGAGAIGGFNSQGQGGDVAGIGYVKGDGEGNISSGGVVKAGDDIYAGKDGNVYKRGEDGSWSQVEGPAGEPKRDTAAMAELDRQRAARDRGYQRDYAGDRAYGGGGARGDFDRGSYGGSHRGSMGGYRGGSMGGGYRGGGGRRR